MHDRRIDGKAHRFGNYWTLYKNAMTWFDHETSSIWSQPMGTAIDGTYRGVRLPAIAANVLPWRAWREEHPSAQVLVAPEPIPLFREVVNPFEEAMDGHYVVGVVIGKRAKAYAVEALRQERVVNDWVGDVPVVVYSDAAEGAVRVFVRKAGGETLDLTWSKGALRDPRTGTTWDPLTGHGLEGSLRGRALQRVPTLTAYDWAWLDFYPGEVYGANDPP